MMRSESTITSPTLKRLLWSLMSLNAITMAASYGFLPVLGPLCKALGLQAWHAGLVVSLAGLAWASAAPRWAKFADYRGQKTVLLWALPGFVLWLLLMAVYADVALHLLPSLWISLVALLLVRSLTSACFAALPTSSTAWLAQMTLPQERTALLARFSAAGALGMVLSPPLAGALMQLNLTLPLYVSALLPLAVLPILWRLPAARPVSEHAKAETVSLSSRDVRLRAPLTAVFVLFSSVLVADINLSFWLIDVHHLPLATAGRTTGWALGCAGAALIVVQGIMGRQRILEPAVYLRCGALIGALGFSLPVMAAAVSVAAWLPVSAWVCVGYTVAGAGMGMAFPSATALCANAVAIHEQNAAAGRVAMTQGLAMGITPLLGGALYIFHASTPFFFVAAALLCVAALRLRR